MNINPLKGLIGTIFNSALDAATNYLLNSPADTVYRTSQWAFSSSVELATFLGDKVAHLPEYLINNAAEFATGNSTNSTLYKDTIRPILEQNNPFSYLNEIATKILAPQAYQFAQQNAEFGVSTFQASDLLGPALILAYSSKKTTENVVKAITKIGYLVTFKRSIVTLYKIPEASKDDKCTVSIEDQEYLSSGTLLLGAGWDFFCAGGWFVLGRFEREGMMRALIEAGNEAPVAGKIINAIIIATIAWKAMPAVWNTAKAYLANRPQKSIEEVSTICVDGHDYDVMDLIDPPDNFMGTPLGLRLNPITHIWEEAT